MKRISGNAWWVMATLVVAGGIAPAASQSRMSVTDENNFRRTCPSLECGSIGRFYEGESIVVYETINGWSRVSEYYTAGCFDGRSIYVESGSDACTAENGIRQGELAEWIRTDFLAKAGDIAG
ncbi:hypothetical protein [Aliihoeflea sp. 40Bstr573]|uniref:hypothetical protein n=1 Tax=Aliihoeflea sp. 40Bstr573 TaxID=2696467 RepID=UPI00209605BA|nr:hypothetical protein [Aliihoeflea sp. 40Bstr573]MCO6387893.1 hypothetical protein [Aliihoeflea sp. 40Bstr573]